MLDAVTVTFDATTHGSAVGWQSCASAGVPATSDSTTRSERRRLTRRRAGTLAQLHVRGLGTLVPGTREELDLVTFAQILELRAADEPAPVEEHVGRAVVGRDEAESLVAHDL